MSLTQAGMRNPLEEMSIIEKQICYICDGKGHDGKHCLTRKKLNFAKEATYVSITVHDAMEIAHVRSSMIDNANGKGNVSGLHRYHL